MDSPSRLRGDYFARSRPLARQMLDMQQWSNARYGFAIIGRAGAQRKPPRQVNGSPHVKAPAGVRRWRMALLEVFGKKDEARARYEAAIAQQPRAR